MLLPISIREICCHLIPDAALPVFHHPLQNEDNSNYYRLVGWSLTSLFSTNTAISETKGQGWRVILLPSEGRLAIYKPQPWPPFCSAATQKGKGFERLIMVALCNRADHYIFAVISIFLSFFPRVISAVGDWMSTILPHMVWP